MAPKERATRRIGGGGSKAARASSDELSQDLTADLASQLEPAVTSALGARRRSPVSPGTHAHDRHEHAPLSDSKRASWLLPRHLPPGRGARGRDRRLCVRTARVLKEVAPGDLWPLSVALEVRPVGISRCGGGCPGAAGTGTASVAVARSRRLHRRSRRLHEVGIGPDDRRPSADELVVAFSGRDGRPLVEAGVIPALVKLEGAKTPRRPPRPSALRAGRACPRRRARCWATAVPALWPCSTAARACRGAEAARRWWAGADVGAGGGAPLDPLVPEQEAAARADRDGPPRRGAPSMQVARARAVAVGASAAGCSRTRT